MRKLGRVTPHTYEIYREFMDTRPPEVLANIAICLIHQTPIPPRRKPKPSHLLAVIRKSRRKH